MSEMKQDVKKIIDKEYVYERFAIEGDLLIAISTVVINGYTLYLWGSIRDIEYFVNFFEYYGLKVGGVIDPDKKKQGMSVANKKIISPEEFVEVSENTFVFILTTFFSGMAINGFKKYLKNSGFYHFSGEDITAILGYTHDWIDRERAEYYKLHKNEIINLVSELDKESQKTVIAYIRSYMNREVYRGPYVESKYKYFYGKNKENIYLHKENENWLNCGASVGDTIYAYYMNGLVGNVYAIEAEHRKYVKLKENISYLPERIKRNITCYETFIDEKTDFKNIIGENKISLINADIEGGELKLLKNLKMIIVRDRPVIAICIYHLKEDLIDIPKWVDENLIGYKKCVRKYTSWVHNTMQNFELVLYAIPNERYVYNNRREAGD